MATKKKIEVVPIAKKVKWYTKTWKYLEPIWLGNDGKISLKNISAFGLVIHFMYIMNTAPTLAGIEMTLTVEMAGILTMMGFSVWSNIKHTQIDAEHGLLNKPSSSEVPPEQNRPTD